MPNLSDSNTKALVTGIYLNEYDRVVKPQQRFLIPNYFIEYWVSLLGPTLSWIVVSLQQACWRENSDRCAISQAVIADEIGIERRTVSRVLKENPLRPWFIPKFEYQKGVVHRASKTYQPLPYKYSVYLSIPLTPEHTAGLFEYFRQECPTASSSNIEQAIQKLLDLKSRDALTLLDKYYHEATRNFETPLPLPEIVEAATGFKIKTLPSTKATEIEQKLSGLHTHLTEIGHTICRQYFRLNWVPLLGPAMAWLVMALRSRCYYNPDSKELRDVCVWRKKELAAMIGQSRYNLRLLLTHPYAEHFFQIFDHQKHQLTVKVSIIQEPLISETPAEFWNRQPRNLLETLSSSKNVENCDIIPNQNVENCDITSFKDVDFCDMGIVKNVENCDITSSTTLKNMTSLQKNGENSDTLKYLKESVLNVVEKEKISENRKDLIKQTRLQELLLLAGLSGIGLDRLCHKDPPLDPQKVKAVLLYARANNLGPGYIYNHLARDAAIDELYLRFAMLDESNFELFQRGVNEIKVRGDGLIPVSLSIPPEQIDLFAQFAEIFAGVDATTVALALRCRQTTDTPAISLPSAQPLDYQNEPADEKVRIDQNDIETLWNHVLGLLQLQMPRSAFDMWLKDTQLITRKGSKFIVAVGSGYAKEWLENRLLTTIRRTLSSFIKTDGVQKLPELEIEFVVKA